MKNIKRFISCVLCVLLCSALLLTGTGCSEKYAAMYRYNIPEAADRKISQLESACVADNSRYSLIWDADDKRVFLYDKIEDCNWTYTPQDSLDPMYDAAGEQINVHPILNSPIIVNYNTTANNVKGDAPAWTQSINAKKENQSPKVNNFTLTKIENGIEMMLYFDKYEFAVPVSFTLKNDGMVISVDPEKIEENSEYNVTSIEIAPLACSVSNERVGNKSNYLFMPSGSGTIIYPEYKEGDTGEYYDEYVYGGDLNVEQAEQIAVTENVRMPVYGAVNDGRALCAIVEDGAESVKLTATLGQKITGYSYISPEFQVRGYQQAIKTLFTNTVVKTSLYADAFINSKISVGFYPLYGDDANYMGMADKYRSYLESNGSLSTDGSKDSLLNLKLYGGIKTKKFTLGVPGDAMLTATTLKQAYNIVDELSTETKVSGMNVNLIGFGSNGNDIGVVAGDYEIASDFGDDGDMEKLSKYCKNSGINLFMNFDMVRFNSSGGGISTTFGRADAANGSYSIIHHFDMALRTNSTTLAPYYLVGRDNLAEIAENINEAAGEYKLGGVSLDTLTSIVYSDYSNKDFYSANNCEKQFGKIINNFKSSGYAIAGSDANAFAAALCSHVYDAPIRSSRYYSYDVDIPFYEIVFKGRVSMSATSLNLATDENEIILHSAETGMGLTYSLVGSYDTNLITSAQNVFYGSLYWDETNGKGIKTDIIEKVAAYKDYFESVNGAEISNHEIVNEDVRKTTFDNGVVVYVNYGKTDYQSDKGVVKAHGYLPVKEA